MESTTQLAVAGISFLGELGEQKPLIPPVIVNQATSCPLAERRAELDIKFSSSELRRELNDAWYRMAVEYGLFTDGDRQFLLPLGEHEDGPSRWVHVELQDQWDIFGAGAAGGLGSGWCRPEFRMLSSDGSVLICGSTAEFEVNLFAVPEPSRSMTLRRFADWVVASELFHPADTAAVRAWLAATRCVD